MLLKEEKIFNYLNGFSDQTEKTEVEVWKAESQANQAEFEKLKRIHELSLIDTGSLTVDVDRGWSKVSDELFASKQVQMPVGEIANNKSFEWKWVYRIAAILVLAVGISYIYSGMDKNDSFDLAYTTKSGEIKEIKLSDGTVVFVNENSSFHYFKQPNDDSRRVFLKGEAYFEVAKDQNRPFTIYSPSASTRVLGTSFNLKTAQKGASIDVFSGKVAFGDLSASEKNILLIKGQRAAFKEGKVKEMTGTNHNALAWKTGILMFQSEPISGVVKTLEKFYKVDIKYDDNISNCLITSKFENKSLSEVLKVIEIISQIKNTTKDGVVYLSGPGCK